LANPSEPKFRRINLEGKAGAKLVAVPAVIDFLKRAGFVETEGHLELHAEVPLEPLAAAAAVVQAASAAMAAPRSPPAPSTEGLSLKQKALLQQEEKARLAREQAKIVRKAELQKIAQDKVVRQRDENWKPQAAGVKGGKSIETYRGKFGEDKGG